MSSLQSIMNLDDDQPDAASPLDKKDKDASTPASGFRARDPSSSTPSVHVTRSDPSPPSYSSARPTPSIHSLPTIDRHSAQSSIGNSYPRQQLPDPHPRLSSAVQQGKRPVETGTTASTLSAIATRPGGSRRQSSTSVDSMDQHGYGSASSSSMGGGVGSGGYLPNQPRRPMGSPSPDVPIRLTPITGRVSRAKKGVPVHVCDTCNPPKTFTRAEHLRRHQLSHQQPQYECDKCDRAFHRLDLLTRHQQRHNEETDRPSPRGVLIRRDSRDSVTSSTLEERMPSLAVTNLQQPLGYATGSQGLIGRSTPSSTGEMPPGTPPTGSHPGSAMSPAPGPSESYGPSPGQGSGSGDHYTHYRGTGFNASGNIESSPEPTPLTNSSFAAPRTAPMPALFVTTQGLASSTALHTSLDNVPELSHTTDYSSWTSASDSTHSNGSEGPRRRQWRHAHHSSLDWPTSASLLPAIARRELTAGGVGLETMATPYYMPATTFPMSPHMAPPQTTYHPLINEQMVPDFSDEQTQSFLDPSMAQHSTIHQRAAMRRATPPTSTSASGSASDALIAPAPLPHPINALIMTRHKEMVMDDDSTGVGMGSMDGDSPHWGHDDSTGLVTSSTLSPMGGCSMNSVPTTMARLSRSVQNAIPAYLDVYWEHFHKLYPVVHRHTFEGQSEEVLRCAMAAVATQFLNGKEDRIRGSQLHEFAWQEAKRHPQWNLQIMQAILLCEHFARFRGRKPAVRASKAFENLYARVLDHNPTLYDAALPTNAAAAFDSEPRWREWLEAEGRRRLLAGCFILDNHAAMLHQQPRAREDVNPSSIPLTTSSDALWAAASANEWAAVLAANPAAGQPQFLPHVDTLRADNVPHYAILDQASILNAAALSLPRRPTLRCSIEKSRAHSPDDLRTPTTASYSQTLRSTALPRPDDRLTQLFSHSASAATANLYVALHHTPLHDLLAVSGDSWIFSLKVLGAPTFLEHQKRLKAWVEGRASSSNNSPVSPTTAGLEGLSSSKAVVHAARALVGYLDRDNSACISVYWGMYVCVLIIWAFAHRVSSSSSSSGSSKSSSSNSGSPTTARGAMSEDDAVNWLRLVGELSQPEQVVRIRGRREASAAIVSMVRRRLEADCVGGRSRLYLDAVTNLRKLAECVNWRWF